MSQPFSQTIAHDENKTIYYLCVQLDRFEILLLANESKVIILNPAQPDFFNYSIRVVNPRKYI